MNETVLSKDYNRTMKILVAEDEVLVRLMLADTLRAEGYDVLEAADADQAIAAMKSHSNVDLVICDMRMRSMDDGIALARYVRGHHPRVALVLASAYQPPKDQLFDAYFQKPYEPKDIARWVRLHIADRVAC